MKIKAIFGKIIYHTLARVFYTPRLRGSTRTRVLLFAGDQLLLVRPTISSQRWNLPGGGIAKGESPHQGAARELYEETGIRIAPEAFSEYGRGSVTSLGAQFDVLFLTAHLARQQPLKPRLEILEGRYYKTTTLPENLHPTVKTALQLHNSIAASQNDSAATG